MFARMFTARTGRGRFIAVGLLLVAVAMGLAACRGFFGQAPIALLVIDAGGDSEIPVAVDFDISESTDPDGTIVAYVLDYGDGSTPLEGVDVTDAITYTYDVAGTYTVVLTVTDNDGRVAMVNQTFTIGPVMITFAANRIASYDIFRMQSDGTGQAAVFTTNTVDELFPNLVRRTRDWIAYAAEDGADWNIWKMNVTGGGRTQLTRETGSNQIQPSWSYDATKIAYASNDTQTPSQTTWEIWTMTSTGDTQTQLTLQTPSWAIAPAYSPVNNDLVFVSDKDSTGDSSLWMREADGTTFELYDTGDVGGRAGDASPAIAGLAVGLELPTDAGISVPSWSPDGAHIAFARQRGTGEIDIYIVESSGSSPETLEDFVNGETGTATNITTDDDEFCPFWLEDNSGIAYVKDDGTGAYQIYVVEFATGTVTKLTALGDNLSPASER